MLSSEVYEQNVMFSSYAGYFSFIQRINNDENAWKLWIRGSREWIEIETLKDDSASVPLHIGRKWPISDSETWLGATVLSFVHAQKKRNAFLFQNAF